MENRSQAVRDHIVLIKTIESILSAPQARTLLTLMMMGCYVTAATRAIMWTA